MLEYTSQRKFNKHSGEMNPKKFKEISKDASLRLILKDKGVKKHFTNLLVLTCVFRYFWKWGNIRKSVRWNRRLRLLFTLWIGISKKFHYVLAKILQNDANLGIQKVVSKITGIWNTSDKRWKVQKVEIWWAFVQKYIPSAKILYTVDLSNITFNYLCVDSPNYLCHFWNHKSFFTTQLLCIFLVQIFRLFHCSG